MSPVFRRESEYTEACTSASVLMINAEGIMLSVQGHDYFLSYNRIPWMQDAPSVLLKNTVQSYNFYLKSQGFMLKIIRKTLLRGKKMLTLQCKMIHKKLKRYKADKINSRFVAYLGNIPYLCTRI